MPLKFSLACPLTFNCPLGEMRLQLPCRATTCSQLECFDALLFLQLNFRNTIPWPCPVCDKNIMFDDLVVDRYFFNIIYSPVLPWDTIELKLNADGTWAPLLYKKLPTSKFFCVWVNLFSNCSKFIILLFVKTASQFQLFNQRLKNTVQR